MKPRQTLLALVGGLAMPIYVLLSDAGFRGQFGAPAFWPRAALLWLLGILIAFAGMAWARMQARRKEDRDRE